MTFASAVWAPRGPIILHDDDEEGEGVSWAEERPPKPLIQRILDRIRGRPQR